MRIPLAIAATSLMVPALAMAQTDTSATTSSKSTHARMKHHKSAAISSGTAGYTSNTESGQSTPQSAPGASTDGSRPGTSSGAPINTDQTTSSTGDPSAPAPK